jgi:hypothetical protein
MAGFVKFKDNGANDFSMQKWQVLEVSSDAENK